jgi:hypothetical protein
MVTLVFALILAVSVATGLWSATADQEAGPAPTELAGYRLLDSVTGSEAVAQVNELHGTDIDIADAWIGQYQQGGTVWAARASSEAKARELMDDMVLNIEDGGSPFWGLTRQEFQGMPLYSVRDSRQVHFFYQIDAQVVWLAAPPGDEDAFLAKAVREVS